VHKLRASDNQPDHETVVRPDAVVTAKVTAGWSLFAQVENIGNSQLNAGDNT